MICLKCGANLSNENIRVCKSCKSASFWFYSPSRCQCCQLTFNELSVHHIDGNEKNNELNNKIKVCKFCHVRIHNGADTHRRGRKPKTVIINTWIARANIDYFRGLWLAAKSRIDESVVKEKVYL